MKKLIVLFIVSLFAFEAMAWDAVGHRIVADIAYANLSKKARRQVDAVLGTRGMIYASSWPDEIKSDTIYPNSYGWHFQNLNEGLSHADLDTLLMEPLREGEHLFYALDSLTKVLKEDGNNPEALKFVVHLVGDEFQPMHMGHSSDLGANRIQMVWFGSKTNLHSLWDRWLINYTQYSYSEYSRYLQDKYKKQKKAIMKLTDEECLYRTYDAVTAVYDYQKEIGEQPKKYEYKYYYNMKSTLEYQLYAAGIRLAMLLEEIY